MTTPEKAAELESKEEKRRWRAMRAEINEQERRRLRHAAATEEATARKEARYAEKHGGSQKTCHNCGQAGHKQAQCPVTKRVKKTKVTPRLKALRRLGLDESEDTPELIKAAYRQMALLYHPDKNETDTTALFQEIQNAHQFLTENPP